MNSFSMSFWIVPPSLLPAARPARSATARYIASRTLAEQLTVIDVVTSSSGMPSKSALHVVERRDRDALAADLAARARVVGVVAHERRHVEGGREAGLPLREQEVEARVGVLGACRSRRTGASSTAGRGTCSGRRRACTGTRRACRCARRSPRDVVGACRAARPPCRRRSRSAPVAPASRRYARSSQSRFVIVATGPSTRPALLEECAQALDAVLAGERRGEGLDLEAAARRASADSTAARVARFAWRSATGGRLASSRRERGGLVREPLVGHDAIDDPETTGASAAPIMLPR